MKALVISGGGSKGAFAGGVAQYLIQDLKHDYDLYLGTSTGSLLVPHLSLGKVDKVKEMYTSVNQSSIFSNCPFIIKKKFGEDIIEINHWNVLKNFLNIGAYFSMGDLQDKITVKIEIKLTKCLVFSGLK